MLRDVLSWRTLQNSKQNHIVARGGESREHFLKKCEVCWGLHNEGKRFYCEAIFKNGSGRADVYVVDDDLCVKLVDLVPIQELV